MTDPTTDPGAHPGELLPALAADGTLDVDALSARLPALRTALIDSVRQSATLHRQGRGTVVAPEDTYQLTRRLTAGGEVLRRAAEVFTAAAKECDALTEEEALTAMGEQDGVLSGSLFVPDGEGQRIAVRANYQAAGSLWDTVSLTGWLAETAANDWRVVADAWWARLRASDLDNPDLVAADRDAILLDAVATVLENVTAQTLTRLIGLGRYQPSVTKVEELRVRAAEQGDDATASVLGQLRTRGDRRYLGVQITREASPKGRKK